MGAYVCGIDIGTSGVKVIILRKDGFVSARGHETMPAPIVFERERFQDAQIWWEAVSGALKHAVNALRNIGGRSEDICSICIDATSGTIVPVDEHLEPIYTGIMYNDARAQNEVPYLNEVGKDSILRLGYQFNSSFALPKILHIKNNLPHIWGKTRYILHQADFIALKLMGKEARVLTDASNALKTGYDILESRWPHYIKELDIEERLPGVVPTGSILGIIQREIAREFGFSTDVKIIAGMTDSVAACVASGARKPGDMNTTLGSTLTWKVLSEGIVSCNQGLVYSHLHPSGCFLPGGAGNSGGHGIKNMLQASPDELTAYAAKMDIGEPSDCYAYPLPARGERFPFIDPEFEPFTTIDDLPGGELYKSLVAGVSCIERLGYETIASMGAGIDGDVWTTGGGAMVDIWMKIRANVLNRAILRAKYPESAYGSALIAAMRTWFKGDFIKTADSFILEQSRFEPDSMLVSKYQAYYENFLDILSKKKDRV